MDTTYKTSSMYTAAALRANGAQFLRVDLDERRHCYWVFADPDATLAHTERLYHRQQLGAIEPLTLFQALFTVRDTMRQALGAA